MRPRAWKHHEFLQKEVKPLPEEKDSLFDGSSLSLSHYYNDETEVPMDVYSSKIGFLRKQPKGYSPSSPTKLIRRVLHKNKKERQLQYKKPQHTAAYMGSGNITAASEGTLQKLKRELKLVHPVLKPRLPTSLVSKPIKKERSLDEFTPAMLGYLPYKKYTEYLRDEVDSKWVEIDDLYQSKQLYLYIYIGLIYHVYRIYIYILKCIYYVDLYMLIICYLRL